jgi:hypothetical protein
MNNPGLVVGKNGAIIIDPGSAYGVGKNVMIAVEKITNKPIVAVFNTILKASPPALMICKCVVVSVGYEAIVPSDAPSVNLLINAIQRSPSLD